MHRTYILMCFLVATGSAAQIKFYDSLNFTGLFFEINESPAGCSALPSYGHGMTSSLITDTCIILHQEANCDSPNKIKLPKGEHDNLKGLGFGEIFNAFELCSEAEGGEGLNVDLYYTNNYNGCRHEKLTSKLTHSCEISIVTLLQHYIAVLHDPSFHSLSESVLTIAADADVADENCKKVIQIIAEKLEFLANSVSSPRQSIPDSIVSKEVSSVLLCLEDLLSSLCQTQSIVCDLYQTYFHLILNYLHPDIKQQLGNKIIYKTALEQLQMNAHTSASQTSEANTKSNVDFEMKLLATLKIRDQEKRLLEFQRIFSIWLTNKATLRTNIFALNHAINMVLSSHREDSWILDDINTTRSKIRNEVELYMEDLAERISNGRFSSDVSIYSSNTTSAFMKSSFDNVIAEIASKAIRKNPIYVSKLLKFVSALRYSDHQEKFILAMVNSKVSFEDSIKLAESLKQFPELVAFKNLLPKMIQNIVWGAICSIVRESDGRTLRGGDVIKNAIQRDVYHRTSGGLETQWELEPIESTNGMFKLLNLRDYEYMSAAYPYRDGSSSGTSHTDVITTNYYTDCPYYFLWRIEEGSGESVYIIHNATNSYMALYSLDNYVRLYFEPQWAYADLFRLVCSG